MLTWIIIATVIIFADQLTKWLAIILLQGSEPHYVIDGVLRFVYVENDGAAFGMLDEHRWVFLVLSVLTITGLLIYLWRCPPKSVFVRIGVTLIIGGGIGNMIDRVMLGYVVDFIDFCAFPKVWMWVFNIADSCICVGVAMLMVYLLADIIREYKKERAKKKSTSETVAPPEDDIKPGEGT